MAAAKIAFPLLLLMMLHVGDIHAGARQAATALKDAMEHILTTGNFAIGSFSRSYSITTMSKQNRLDDIKEIQTDLAMTISTLAVLDIGGGAMLPVTNFLVDKFTVGKDFAKTRAAFLLEGNQAVQKALVDFGNGIKKGQGMAAAKDSLLTRKLNIEKAFDDDIAKILKSPAKMADNADMLAQLGKVKRMFKVKFVAQALGPVFDLVNIGMSTYSLTTTAIACTQDPKSCNYGALVSSSLCIASGIVGILAFALAGTAFGPVGTAVALLLGIAATLIELFWPPPIDHEKIQFQKRAETMFRWDKHSRMQLEANTHFLWSSGLQNVDLYVINQGHFPNWMENTRAKIPQLSGPIKFGYGGSADYNRQGRMKKKLELKGECDSIGPRGPPQLPEPQPGDQMCIYFQEGYTDEQLTVTNSLTDGNTYNFGPSFYGIAENWHDGHKRTKPNGRKTGVNPQTQGNMASRVNKAPPPYKGVMIFVNTNNVTEYWLTEAEDQGSKKDTDVKLRGLNIDTERKFQNIRKEQRDNYNDVIGIADMRNLAPDQHITIKTGEGRDALNIDGWVWRLNANLGPNHNTLSFNGMSLKPQKRRKAVRPGTSGGDFYSSRPSYRCEHTDTMFYDYQIQGVKFNPGDGKVKYITKKYDSCRREFNTRRWPIKEEEVGEVHRVGILNGSPFDLDEYTLYARQHDPANPDDHYTIFKFKGKAKYIFDARSYKHWELQATPHFKIVDGTSKAPACNWRPELYIKNLEALKKDIVFMNDKIHIYERGFTNRRLLATISFFTSCTGRVIATDRDGKTIIEGDVSDLDNMEYTGDRYTQRFDGDVTGNSALDDIAYLQCPRSKVTVTRKIKDVSIIVVNKKFIDSCHIDKANKVTVLVEDASQGAKNLKLTFNNVGKFGAEQKIEGVKRIVNEWGRDMVNFGTLDNGSTFDLFDLYHSMAGVSLLDESKLSQGVKDNMQACIRSAAAKRDGLTGVGNINTGDFTKEQLDEICDFDSD